MAQQMGYAEGMVQVAASELETLRANSARWVYYAQRVADQVGISLEQMEREVDDAIARDLLPTSFEP